MSMFGAIKPTYRIHSPPMRSLPPILPVHRVSLPADTGPPTEWATQKVAYFIHAQSQSPTLITHYNSLVPSLKLRQLKNSVRLPAELCSAAISGAIFPDLDIDTYEPVLVLTLK